MLQPALRLGLAVTFAASISSFAQEAKDKPKPARPAAAKGEKKERKGTKWDLMDVGPFFSSGLAGKHQTLKALTIKVATNATVCFDTELLRMSAGWTGGFLLLATGRDGLEGVPEPVGVSAFATSRGPGWGKDGIFTDPRPPAPEDRRGKPVGPMPKDWAHWRGVYLHGNDTVLSYSVGAAGVLELLVNETPGASASVDGNLAVLTASQPKDGMEVSAAMFKGHGAWTILPDGQMRLKISPGRGSFQVAIWSGAKADF